MRIRGLLLCAAIIASAIVPAIAPANAEMRISEDRGGQIGRYLQAYAMLRSSGERVVVDGNCLSACTLVLGVIPHERICATSRARFGFHAAWMPDEDGRPVTSHMGTQALWDVYPARVRHWINRHGGLTRHMIFMQGSALHGIVQSCTPHRTINARSHRHYRTPVGYQSARASSYRH
jgi:hypothetical protein